VVLGWSEDEQQYVQEEAPDALEPDHCEGCSYQWMPLGQQLHVVVSPGWVVGPFSDALELPGAQVLVEPHRDARVDRDADLTVRWDASAARPDGKDRVEVTVRSLQEGDTQVVCSPARSEALTIPADLLQALGGGRGLVMLRVVRERPSSAEGTDALILAGSHRHLRSVTLR
jgi:hypothetical protein